MQRKQIISEMKSIAPALPMSIVNPLKRALPLTNSEQALVTPSFPLAEILKNNVIASVLLNQMTLLEVIFFKQVSQMARRRSEEALIARMRNCSALLIELGMLSAQEVCFVVRVLGSKISLIEQQTDDEKNHAAYACMGLLIDDLRYLDASKLEAAIDQLTQDQMLPSNLFDSLNVTLAMMRYLLIPRSQEVDLQESERLRGARMDSSKQLPAPHRPGFMAAPRVHIRSWPGVANYYNLSGLELINLQEPNHLENLIRFRGVIDHQLNFCKLRNTKIGFPNYNHWLEGQYGIIKCKGSDLTGASIMELNPGYAHEVDLTGAKIEGLRVEIYDLTYLYNLAFKAFSASEWNNTNKLVVRIMQMYQSGIPFWLILISLKTFIDEHRQAAAELIDLYHCFYSSGQLDFLSLAEKESVLPLAEYLAFFKTMDADTMDKLLRYFVFQCQQPFTDTLDMMLHHIQYGMPNMDGAEKLDLLEELKNHEFARIMPENGLVRFFNRYTKHQQKVIEVYNQVYAEVLPAYEGRRLGA